MLSIRLFGTPQINHNQQPAAITRRKSRALIYYLAAHATPLSRGRLLGFFWPDHPRPTAQQNLRTTLSGLRKTLGAWLVVDEDTVAVAGNTEVDTRAFESQLSSSTLTLPQLKQTLDLYRGDFLTSFSLADLPEFDDWATVERERYRRLAVAGLIRLSQLYEAQQDFRAGLEALDQALALDPLQEDLQRIALRLHYLAGDRAGAIRRYEQFRQLLSDEMGVPPMEETRTLYDAIITDTVSSELLPVPATSPPLQAGTSRPPQAVGSLPFVGREMELRRLDELLALPKLILLEGEPGIGKSRLIEQFIQTKPRPHLALIGQARELESSLPYHPIIEALRTFLAHPDWPTLRRNLQLPLIWQIETARLLPELAPAEHDPVLAHAADEIRLWEGVSQFLLALARQLPLVLALDDIHWADSATLGLLGYLIRKAGQSAAAIGFIAASRPVEPRSPLSVLLAALLREGRLERITLNRLSDSEITLLAQQFCRSAQVELLADWLVQRSEGNPFILVELMRYARESSLLLPDGNLNLAALLESPVVPPTIYSLIQSRLAHLSEADWQVLNAAVTVGREFEFEIVARATSLPDAAVLDSLDTLQGLGLIQPLGGEGYRFDHPLIMEVAFQEISAPRHRLFHRRVAEAMESLYAHRLDSVAGLLARHYAEGGVPGRAAKYAFRAGRLAADLAAWSEAIAFYEQALAESELVNDSTQRQAILLALGQVYLQAGQLSRASETLRAGLDLAKMSRNQDNAGVLYLNLAGALLLENRSAEVLALAEEIGASRRPEDAANAAYFRGLALAHNYANLADAIAYLQQAEALLRQPGHKSYPAEGVVSLNQIEFELGNIFAQRGDLPAAIEHYRAGLEVSRSMGDIKTLWNHVLFYNNLAYHLHLLDDPTAADYAQQGLALAQENGVLSLLPYLHSTLGEIALARHDLAAAEHHFNEGLTLAQQFSVPERIAGLTANLGLLAKQRGQSKLAIEHLTSALTQAEALSLRFLATQIRLWLTPLLPPAEARAHLAAARSTAEHDGYDRLLAETARLEAEIQ